MTEQGSAPSPKEILMNLTELVLEHFTREILTNSTELDSELFIREILMNWTTTDSGLSIDISNNSHFNSY